MSYRVTILHRGGIPIKSGSVGMTVKRIKLITNFLLSEVFSDLSLS